MKKMNILFILITSILIFGTTNVFALNYDYVKKGEWAAWPNTGNKKVLLSNYDSSLQNSSDSYSYRTTINFDTDRVLNNGANYGFARFTIEGIDTQLLTQTNDFNVLKYYYRVQLKEDTGKGYSKCEVDDGYILCPLVKDGQYSALLFDNLKTMDIGQVYIHFMIWSPVDLINYISQEDTNKIIENNNQNTETIVNNITTPSIDSNTTNTDNLITIPSSNGKNVVLDLLMTPVNLFTNIVNSFSNSCVSYNLGNLLGTDLILPCVNLQNILGSSLYTIIDSIFAFGMLFAFIRSVKRFIQKALLLASDVSSEVSIF